MEGDLSEVGYPPRPLPFPILPKDVNIDVACETWLAGKIFRLEEFVCSVVESALLKQDILFALMTPQTASQTTRTPTTTSTTPTNTENSEIYAGDKRNIDDLSFLSLEDSRAAGICEGRVVNERESGTEAAVSVRQSPNSGGASRLSANSSAALPDKPSPSISAAAVEAANAFASDLSIASVDPAPSLFFRSDSTIHSSSNGDVPNARGAESSIAAASTSSDSLSLFTIPATSAISTTTNSFFSITTTAAAAATAASPASLFPDPSQKLMKLISLQLECSKLQSTLLSMGESIGDSRVPREGARFGPNHSGSRKEPLLAVMCGNGYDRAAQAFLEAAVAVELAIHTEGMRVGKSDLLEAWHLDPDVSASLSATSSSSSSDGRAPRKHLRNLLKSLLEHPSQPRSYRPLHLAALHGRRDFGRLLLHYGADVDGRDKKNRTALYWALKSHNEEMALMLLRHGATVTDREYSMALERLYLDVIEAMVSSSSGSLASNRSCRRRSQFCCDPNILRVSKRKGKGLFTLGDIVSSPMRTVVEAKFKPVSPPEDDVKFGDSSEDYLRVALSRMFDDDDDVDIPASSRQRRRSISPLVDLDDDLPAAYASKTPFDCVNCRFQDTDEREALRLKTEILDLLMARGGEINVTDTKRSPLLAAARKGDERMLEWLTAKGGNLHIVFADDYYDDVVGNVSRGSTLLHYASPRVIPYLISNGVDPSAADSEGRAPFYVKAKAGCVTSMTILVQFYEAKLKDRAINLCPSFIDHEGDPLLCFDGSKGDVRICELNVHGSRGDFEKIGRVRDFDINAKTKKGKTALLVLLVKMASSPKMLDFVLAHPFDPNVFDGDGWSVIFYAAVLGSIDIINALISKGAKIDVVDNFGNYPFIYALVAHNFSCATILVKGFRSERRRGRGVGGSSATPFATGESTGSLPSDWVSPFSSIDNISIITRKVKSVFKGIYKNLYEPVDDADSDEEPYLTAPAQPLLHLALSHGFLHALEDPLNTLFSRPYTSSSRVKAVYRLMEALLQRGYDPNLKSLRNETALGLLLSMRGWRQGLDVPATTLLLLHHGADATVLDGRGRNFLDLTLRSNDLENSTYLYLCGATLKPRQRDRVKELVATHDPHAREERGDVEENESLITMLSAGCPYGARQRCLSCVVDFPLSLKESARIVIRRKLALATSLTPLLRTRRELRLPRELHSYLYLGDVVAPAGVLTLGNGSGSFDWLDAEELRMEEEEEEEERRWAGEFRPVKLNDYIEEENGKSEEEGAAGLSAEPSWIVEDDEMEERRNILPN